MSRDQATPAASAAHAAPPLQQVVKVRRDYNTWVANETLEDYALRFTPRAFRKWSEWRIANTAFSGASFLVLEAIGGTITINYGFINAFWAILTVGLAIFLTGLPISLYASRHGVDMDLLTRGAGFGYIGSTITSLIYASYTFILLALEAAIMAYALELCFDIPLYLAYLLSALVVIPLVTYGITLISRIQMVTQPLWIGLMLLPIVAVLHKEPDLVAGLMAFDGKADSSGFNIVLFGAATAVGVALITQIGEQVDYLRFMPSRTPKNRGRWLCGVLLAGPGWVLVGVLKMLAGATLAFLLARNGFEWGSANNPTQMYLLGYSYVFERQDWVVWSTTLFVCISQIKINMTNAYAGSLAWSNFFARLTHSHPGRVVWTVFNAAIAVALMELNVFHALEQVLGLFSNLAISWIAAVVADLVINKPLGLSPPGIETRRAYLCDINPVGVGAMVLASTLSTAAFLGLFGPYPQAFSAFIAMGTALAASPLIAWSTQGRYYIARRKSRGGSRCCSICERTYEPEDMAYCPAYRGPICSLCCTLDARCGDLCKPPEARLEHQVLQCIRSVLPRRFWPLLSSGLSQYLMVVTVITTLLAAALGLIYDHERALVGDVPERVEHLQSIFLRVFSVVAFLSGLLAWWLVLTNSSRRVAQEESNRQTALLMREIESHRQTDEQLQTAKRQADQASLAKSRYITAISHELRTPLNSMLGYAQILAADESIPERRRKAVRVIRDSGDHLLALIENTLDIARIESGRVTLDVKPMHFADFLRQTVQMFELQAREKGLDFRYKAGLNLPLAVRADKRRFSQVLINLLDNAIKFTDRGHVMLRVSYAREMATFEIEDSGPGIPQKSLKNIFEPFAQSGRSTGTGMGLTICKMLTELMGGEIAVSSELGQGSTFRIRLFLPEVRAFDPQAEPRPHNVIGYKGSRRRILVVDNERIDRELLVNVLEPLGFLVREAESGHACLEIAPVFMPHLILVDLAMPGMDGWETIVALQRLKLEGIQVAVVSANAFDRALENDVGITPADFIVKPVLLDEFLEWLGRKLGLSWTRSDSPRTTLPVAAAPEVLIFPPQDELRQIEELVSLGYVRGILKKVDELEAVDTAYSPFAVQIRRLAGRFQMDGLAKLVRKGFDESHG